MRYVRKYKPKFFPFSAGIPWKIERGKYIIPEIDLETWHKVTDGKDIIITAFGGLFESLFSLCAAEAIASFAGSHNLFWLGNPEFSCLANFQGLCKFCNITLTPEMLKQYPVPLFFDQDHRVYFNVLNNYLIRTSYWGKYPEAIDVPVTEQIFRNVMIPWRDYLPILRNLGTDFFDGEVNIGRFNTKTRIVLIILNQTKNDILDWSIQNIKEFSQLASHKGLKTVVFSHNPNAFHGSSILAYKYDIRKILQVLENSWMVLSNDIDWLLISLMASKAKMISKHIQGSFDLFKNAEILGVGNDIFTDRDWVSPLDAFAICEGLL